MLEVYSLAFVAVRDLSFDMLMGHMDMNTSRIGKPNRRSLVKAALSGCIGGTLFNRGLLAKAGSSSRAGVSAVIPEIQKLHKWNESNGDTWDPFWADDDNLYAFNCDGRGFGTKPRNLAFNKLTGDRPDSLAGEIVNSMDEYGEAGKKEADNATWKACGQECIDGVFYAFVSRNVYGKDSGDSWLRQTAMNSSLIKSLDRGKTWQRDAATNYSSPMWPGPKFGAPFFIHYGKNGGRVTQDEADRYVYAVSTNGFWNDGDSYVLGRIERARLPRLNASDWTYYKGGDGRKVNSWSARLNEAVPIVSRTHQCGQTPPCYIPALKTYLMVLWYNTERMTKWFEPNAMKYDFYQAEHPWGPWRFISSLSDDFLHEKFRPNTHMYGPSVCAKFQEESAEGVRVSLFTSGCPFEDEPSGVYKIWTIPLLLKSGL